LFALLLPYLAWVSRYQFVCDDAFISFRYGRNLARGYGLTYNVSDGPVEGYSNFLWVLLSAVAESQLWDVVWLAPLVSTLCGVVLVIAFERFCRERLGFDPATAFVATAWFAWSPSTAVWSTSGLATMPFALVFFLTAESLLFRRANVRSVVLCALLMLLRSEGLLWVVCLLALSVLSRLLDRERDVLKGLGRVALGVCALAIVYTSFRGAHFGTLVPNTALVKVGWSVERLLRGLQYTGLYALTFASFGLCLLGAPRMVAWRPGAGSVVVLLALAFPAYAVLVGGDFFPMGRLLLPGLLFSAALFGAWVQSLSESAEPRWRRASLWVAGVGLALQVAPGLDVHVVPEGIRSALHFRHSDKEFLSEHARWANMKDNVEGFERRGHALAMLADPKSRLVSQAIGAVGYYSNLYVYDQYGLVSREVASRTVADDEARQSPGHDKFVPASFFVAQKPDILHSRLVQGLLATRLMKDSMDKWDVPAALRERYVPDFVEVELPGVHKRSFLLWVREATPEEHPPSLWQGFSDRRKDLLAELKEQEESS
jgi:arabinofuranosyltransferase